ncbi:hypothetical protein Tco_1196117 [Tanacetum coccineum]
MLVGAAVDQGEGSTQPTEPHHTPVDPIPSISQPPIPSPPHPSPPHQSPPHSPPHPTPHSPPHSTPHYSPTRSYEAPIPEGNILGSVVDSVQLKELTVLVPKLVNRIGSLEKELKETKQTLGNAVLTLVKKVKTLEVALKRKSKKVIVSESEEKESMKEKLADFVTPTKALGEAQEEEISPTILEAAKTLSKVASYGDEINTGRVEINTGIEDVNTGSTKVDTEDIQATHKTKEQIRQEEAGLDEAIRLQAQMDEEVAKQIHLDKMAKLEANYRGSQESSGRKYKQWMNLQKDEYMSTFIKNQSSWKLSQLKKLSFEELKTEFEKLMKSIESFVPMETKGKDEVVKEEETEVPVKKTGKE